MKVDKIELSLIEMPKKTLTTITKIALNIHTFFDIALLLLFRSEFHYSMFMRFLKPAEITTLYLVFLYVLAVSLKASPEFLMHEAIRFSLIGLGFLAPTLGWLKLKKQHIQWDNILITFLILLILADPTANHILSFALGLGTFVIKEFVRIQRHPLFNPAAVSLSILYFFGLTTTWWGVSFSPRVTDFRISAAMLITLPLGLYIIKRYKKLPTLIATIGSFLIGSLALGQPLPLTILLEGTFAFFLLIMATEPKTTPVVDAEECVYGILLGASLAAWFSFKLPLPYLLNLLILNALFGLYKFIQIKRATAPKPAPAVSAQTA